MNKRTAVKEPQASEAPERPNTRTVLLEAGTRVMLEKGYNNTGIAEVLQSAGVPKGSFYYYFESKEDFGLNIIDAFDEQRNTALDKYINDKSKPALQRLRSWCEDRRTYQQSAKCRTGCLIGTLSQEMAAQSEVFRARLEEVLTRWRNKFAACFKEAQSHAQLSKDIDPVDLAEFFLSAWDGSVMRSKIEKNTGPQEVFIRVMFDSMLKPHGK